MMRIYLSLSRGLLTRPSFGMSMLNDYLTKKNIRKQQTEFKKQMQYLANKPSFTLMDYKQRIDDELGKLKSQIRAKMSQDTQQQQRELQIEKKIMSAMFEQQLNMQSPIKFDQKKQMALVSQLTLQHVNKSLNKFDEYKSMHKVLRNLRLNNQALPQNTRELQQLYLASSSARESKKFRYQQYAHVTAVQRNRHSKKTHDHGYFDV